MLNRLKSLSSWRSGSQETIFDIRRHREPVLLNVYDLCQLNDYTIAVGLGVFHSGVQLYGTEFGYGGHSFPGLSGIFQMEPCNHNGDLRDSFRFRQSIVLGHTHLSYDEVRHAVDQLGREFSGRRYNVVSHNCNHFSIKMADLLCGRTIPGWVNRLANLLAHVPFLQDLVTPQYQRRQRPHEHKP